jgi:hypothetical protein
VLDSGCTNHMTRENKMFTSFEQNENASDNIVFADDSEEKVLGLGKIAISPPIIQFQIFSWLNP